MTTAVIIHAITITTATHDGSILSVARTRTRDQEIVADITTASDIHCYEEAPIDGHDGVSYEVVTQQAPSFSIPDRIWYDFHDLLVQRLQVQALMRNTTTLKKQENLGPIPPPPTGTVEELVGVAMFVPKNPGPHPSGDNFVINGVAAVDLFPKEDDTAIEIVLKAFNNPNPTQSPVPPTKKSDGYDPFANEDFLDEPLHDFDN